MYPEFPDGSHLACGFLFQMYLPTVGFEVPMPGMMRSRKSGCLCLDCCGPRIMDRTSEKRDWRHTERGQLAPWELWAGEVRKRIGPHWLEPDCLLYGYWETVREYDGFLNDQARS